MGFRVCGVRCSGLMIFSRYLGLLLRLVLGFMGFSVQGVLYSLVATYAYCYCYDWLVMFLGECPLHPNPARQLAKDGGFGLGFRV